jgi:flagellar protein FliT
MGYSNRQEGPAGITATHPILDHYRAIEGACIEMLEAARRDDWDHVSRLQLSSRGLIESLRSADERTTLVAQDQEEKFRILRRILVIDGELRHLAQPWLRNIDAMFAPRRTSPPVGSRWT